MTRIASAALIVGLLLAVVWAGRRVASQAGETESGQLDAGWAAQHEPQLRRVLNLPAAAKLEFKEVRPGPVAAFSVVLFDLQQGEQRRPFQLTVTRDGRWVLYNRRLYALADPFGPIRQKIKLEKAPARGPADAPVTIVEYSDYTCPYCRQFFLTTERPLLERYEGKVRLVYKNFPLAGLRAWSQDAAVAAACSFQQGNNPFWAYHEKLFQQMPRLKEGRAVFLELGQEAGLDLAVFTACVDQRHTLADVAQDQREGEALGVDGTPTFFVNGRPIPGLLPAEDFFRIVDEELAAAQPR